MKKEKEVLSEDKELLNITKFMQDIEYQIIVDMLTIIYLEDMIMKEIMILKTINQQHRTKLTLTKRV